MDKSHLLITKASTYSARQELEDPEGCFYDSARGAWIFAQTGEFLVKSLDADRPRPTTKKHDLETGEDLKGS